MRHVILSIVMWLLANVVHAFEIEDRAVFGDETGSAPLRIVSNADISYFKPIIDAFRAFRPVPPRSWMAYRAKNNPLTS